MCGGKKVPLIDCIGLGFNNTSTLVGHFVLLISPREREIRYRRK